MPARNLDVRIIAAATAGLCLLAAAAAFFASGNDADGVVLVEPPYDLIIIEEDAPDSFGEVDAIDPAVLAAILIEDDDEWVQDDALADATALVVIEDERADRLLAALMGSVANVDFGPAPQPQSADRVAAPSRVVAPTRTRTETVGGVASMDTEIDELDLKLQRGFAEFLLVLE